VTAPTTTFAVADMLGSIANGLGYTLEVDGIDDEAYGMVVTSDKSFNDILVQHALVYNYQIIDGDPIRIVRRAIGSDLTIDYEINQTDCVCRNGSSAVVLNRVDVTTLPRSVSIQYIDPERLFSSNEQSARHTGAPVTNGAISIQIDFIVSNVQAREMAFDTLYRIWARQLACTFEHNDITIEPGDVIQLTTDQGIYTVLVQEATYTAARTTMVRADVLLTAGGIEIAAGQADTFVPTNDTLDGSAALVQGLP